MTDRFITTTTTLLMIRHGQNDAVGVRLAGWEAVPLNEEGSGQAARLADRLATVRIDAIYSSPLVRARQTAAPLAAARGLEVLDLPEAGEFRMGAFDGRRFSELSQDPAWRRFNSHRSLTRPQEGELMLEVQSRFVAALLRVVDAHAGGVVAVFSHADPIRAAVLFFAGAPIDFFHRLDIAPASITAVALRPDGPALVKVNDTGNLHGLPNF